MGIRAAGRTECFMRDQCRGKRGGNLWLRQRPDRELFIPAVAKCATHHPGGYPLADEQGADDAGNEQEVVESPVNKGDRVDQDPVTTKKIGMNSDLPIN